MLKRYLTNRRNKPLHLITKVTESTKLTDEERAKLIQSFYLQYSHPNTRYAHDGTLLKD